MPKIPRYFHFVFGLKPQREPFHLVYFLCLESCFQVNKPDRVILYYHHMPHGEWWEKIRGRLELVKVPLNAHIDESRYRDKQIASFQYAHHTDFIRLEKLYDCGGVYADIDTLFIHPIPDHLYEHSCVLGREDAVPNLASGEMEESLCNALIMAEPGASFVKRWLLAAPAAFDGSWSPHSCQLANQLSLQYPGEIHIEVARSFYPYMWTESGLRELLLERHSRWEGAYSVHLWSHLSPVGFLFIQRRAVDRAFYSSGGQHIFFGGETISSFTSPSCSWSTNNSLDRRLVPRVLESTIRIQSARKKETWHPLIRSW